ncbi:Cmx/CmrA family chloramphenicol efflux MFS transporter [Streptomyces sp. t39]|uniref:Cmx/CmrA family chloramphenicol efflux MFS transporter n=1 Tax=Streptomyces sp. t39 TaxID=1828156 RepID=UPI0021C99FAD|nr:Cmx/CmrA family chloramphenicol efflux MFS transporter [Streptomyces sp. t39]
MFLLVLALAVFAQGTSEFMLSGLVPGIAADLSVSTGSAASLTSAYALGMVCGAPPMAALSARWPRRRALALFLSVFVAVHVVGALTTSFPLLFATRVAAAVANAGFLAVAMSVATALAAPERQTRATAVLLSGVTLSIVAGVPGGALLGTWAGWRAVFVAVALLCLPALALVLRCAPAGAGAGAGAGSGVPVARELEALASPPVRQALLLAAAVNGATFAAFAYLAVIATESAGLPGGAVPAVLAAFGAGAFAGVLVAGRTGDGRLGRGLVLALLALPAGWAAVALAGGRPVPLFLLAVLLGGLSFGAGSALVGRVMRVASPRAPALSGAFATVALNSGAVAGPLLAGLVTGATGDARDAAWVSTALASAAALPAVALRRRDGRRARAGADA